MAIVRWDPYLTGIQERMNRLFDDFTRSAARPGSEEDWSLGGTWAPAVDIYDHEGSIVLNAEVPGIDPKDVDIHLENNVLTLRGERKVNSEVKRESYHRVERAYGSFSRSFTLPSVVDTEKIKAEYKDGVLRVVLPKRGEALPRQITISVTK